MRVKASCVKQQRHQLMLLLNAVAAANKAGQLCHDFQPQQHITSTIG
jgi:hypothetical protein